MAFLRLLRPRQWSKNGVLFAPLIFGRKLGDADAVLHAVVATAAFSLVAGTVYVFNDLADREKDRLHPEKRTRPLASGAISPGTGIGFGLATATTALAIASWVGTPFLLICLLYLGLQAAYTLRLKQVAVLDVLLIALGFVIRVEAGARAVEVPVSGWLYLCTLCLALFLGFAKRRHELLLLGAEAVHHRKNLADYTPLLLDQLIAVTTSMTLLSYALYTLSEETVRFHHTHALRWTLPWVLYGVFRYLLLVYARSEGGSPERLLLQDRQMLLSVLGYLATVIGTLYLG